MLAQSREGECADLPQHWLVTPGGIGDEVVHRLVLAAHVAGVKARSHRFDALTVAREHQSCRVGTQWLCAVGVAYGLGQQLDVVIKSLFGCLPFFG